MNKFIQQPINGTWILEGATEALKESLYKYPTYDDLRKEHNKYWGLDKKLTLC
jgi:hypothetical protein